MRAASSYKPRWPLVAPALLLAVASIRAWRRLSVYRRAHFIPYIQQRLDSDCGAASLAMVLTYHGKFVPLEELHAAIGIELYGATALRILNAASRYGLRGRGVQVAIEELEYLDPASILHWESCHFVVFVRLRPGGVELVDPASGRRCVPMEQFRRSFTGVALLFQPADSFAPQPTRPARLLRYLKQLVGPVAAQLAKPTDIPPAQESP